MNKTSQKPSSKSPSKPPSKSRGLGRGLDALLGDAPSSKTKEPNTKNGATIKSDNEVPIEFLRANKDQPRKTFHDEGIEELAISIKARGLLQPILVRPLKAKTDTIHTGTIQYEIVAGERRWRAAQKAGLHKVPIVIRDLSDRETAEIGLIENIQRVDLNPMEEAQAYHYLSKIHGHNQEEIAKAVGKSRSHVANMMRLTKLPDNVQKAVHDGVISMGHARALLTSENPTRLYTDIISKDLSVRRLEALIKQEKQNGDPQKGSRKDGNTQAAPKKDADTKALERDLAAALGLEVEINHQKNGSGQVSVNYLDLDQLDDVCRRLLGSAV